ncbi:MAG: heparan-alpha-glucosaminide N-acetyltransferase domain-containing protein [Promethearchaeota archaeon]
MTLPKKTKNGKGRVFAIDNYRGLMIIYIMLIHALEIWLRPEDNFIWGITWLIFDVFGAAAFVFISGISLSLSYHAQNRKIKRDQEFTAWHARLNFIARTSWLAIITFVTHLLNVILNNGDASYWWFWEIMQILVVARLFCYFFLRFSPKFKVLIGFFFFIVTDSLYILISAISVNFPILKEILFEPSYWNNPFPFLGFSLIGCAIGDWINSWKHQHDSEKIPDMIIPKNMLLIGIGFIIISIISGFQLVENEASYLLIFQINRFAVGNWKWPVDVIPQFLIRSSSSWSFFAMGSNLIVLAIFLLRDLWNYVKMERKSSEINGNPSKFLNIFGVWSLTIYQFQHISFLLFRYMLSISVFPFIFAMYLVVFYVIMRFWTDPDKGKSILTFEWAIKQTSILLLAKYTKSYNKKKGKIDKLSEIY